MIIYLAKRILAIIPSFLAILLVVFLLIYFLPGTDRNEFSSYGNGDSLDSILEKTSLHDTAVGKYIRYVYSLFISSDMKGSSDYESSIYRSLRIRVKYTLILTVSGLFLAVIIGIPTGVLAAVRFGKKTDRALSIMTLLLSSLPSYVLAIILVFIFAKWTRWLPLFGIDTPKHFILPALTVGVGGVALISKMTRAAVIEIINKPFVAVLQARGIGNGKIVISHVLRNAMISVMSSINIILSSLLCGSMIVENFFSVPGLGQMIISSISHRSQKMLLAAVAVVAVMLMIVGVISDFICMIINPQLRAQHARKKV